VPFRAVLCPIGALFAPAGILTLPPNDGFPYRAKFIKSVKFDVSELLGFATAIALALSCFLQQVYDDRADNLGIEQTLRMSAQNGISS